VAKDRDVHAAADKATAPEIHAFLLWANALPRFDDILADIRSRFALVDVVRIEWSRDAFARNLTRFYGQSLEVGSEKELHCGNGPFVVVVVEDPEPTYAWRRTTRGRARVNVRMFEAKKRYRRWTGGGHRVHSTVTPREADRDLFLLLGLRSADLADGRRWDGGTSSQHRDLLGAGGWESLDQLLTAIELVVGYVALVSALAPVRAEEAPRLLVDDRWWAAQIAMSSDRPADDVLAPVAGTELRLVLSKVGDGSLPASWQHRLLSAKVREPGGLLVPAPVDRYYLTLHEVASEGRVLTEAERSELERLARELELPPGDYGDPGFAARARDAYVAQLPPPPAAEPPPKRRLVTLAPLKRLVRGAG
jgi:hypothetical protein